MPVPNSFANVTTSIPLSQLDANFNTPITLGNTAIQLGNTVTTLNNMTLANVTVTSGNVTITNVSVTTANVTTANIGTSIITTSETLNYGTANQVQYLNANKVLTGSANLTFDGTTLTPHTLTVSTGVLTVPAGSNTAPSITTSGDTNTGIYFPAADTVAIGTGGTEALRIDSARNMGLGVTPSAWNIGKTFELPNGVSLSANSGLPASYLATNARWNSGWIYTTSAAATYYNQQQGAHAWFTAASGTAGNAITFTQAMTLDASGNFGVGTSSPNRKLVVDGGSSDAYLKLTTSATASNFASGILFNNTLNSDGNIYIRVNGGESNLVFGTGGSERARITSGGYFKASDNGTYAAAAGVYHELKQSAQDYTVICWGTNTGLTSSIQEVYASRSATSAYTFINVYSSVGGTADREFQLRGDGNAYADGTWNNNGADYAEYFESATGAALTLGATVVLDGNKVREATDQDPASAIMGVVRPKEPSKASMVVGNTAWNKWANKYLTDDFDRYIMEDHNVLEWTDEEGKLQTYESHSIPAEVTVPDNALVKTHDDKGNKFQHYKLNPAWNPDAEYINRENRPEWIIVGLVGQVKVLKGQPVNDRWIKMRDVSATVEEWMIR